MVSDCLCISLLSSAAGDALLLLPQERRSMRLFHLRCYARNLYV